MAAARETGRDARWSFAYCVSSDEGGSECPHLEVWRCGGVEGRSGVRVCVYGRAVLWCGARVVGTVIEESAGVDGKSAQRGRQ